MTIPAIPCAAVDVGPQNLSITMPGGAVITMTWPGGGIPSHTQSAKQLLAQVNGALAPLAPFFKVYACLDAVPDIVFDPGKFVTAFADMASMAPAVAIPVMVGKIIDALIAYLDGLVRQLEALVTSLVSIAAAQTKADRLGNVQLAATAACARGKLEMQMASLGAGVSPINAMMGVVNGLLDLVPGAPKLPEIDSLGTDPAAALAPVRAAVDALQAIRGAFPV
jgi:hypothetical protein